MYGDLMKYTTGKERPRSADRGLARQAKAIRDEVRLAAFKVDGALALADHVMVGVVDLDTHRRTLTTDRVTAFLLADIQQNALQQVKRIQRGLYNDWEV